MLLFCSVAPKTPNSKARKVLDKNLFRIWYLCWNLTKAVRKDSKKRFQVNEAEFAWGGFLVDADSFASLPLLARATRAKAHDDPDIVKEVWDQSRTIVTSNRRDFLRYIQEFQSRADRDHCRDLWGLLVIPNAQFDRDKGLKTIRRGLNVLPPEALRWRAAGALNLYVRLTANGKVEIHRFRRCPFCEHPTGGVHIKEPWNAWYHSLPLVGI